jgi:hypothetical protein
MRLELPLGPAFAEVGVRPVDLISVSYVHVVAVFPFVLGCVCRIVGVVSRAKVTGLDVFRKLAVLIRSMCSEPLVAIQIVSSNAEMLSTEVPVDVYL